MTFTISQSVYYPILHRHFNLVSFIMLTFQEPSTCSNPLCYRPCFSVKGQCITYYSPNSPVIPRDSKHSAAKLHFHRVDFTRHSGKHWFHFGCFFFITFLSMKISLRETCARLPEHRLLVKICFLKLFSCNWDIINIFLATFSSFFSDPMHLWER